MWKSIVLCASLFAGAAMALALGARFVEPGAMPAAAAIGLCLVGVVLILAAPTAEVSEAAPHPTTTAPTAVSAPPGDPVELAAPTMANVAPPVAKHSPTPTLPFRALRS
jgi:hypothetical protein